MTNDIFIQNIESKNKDRISATVIYDLIATEAYRGCGLHVDGDTVQVLSDGKMQKVRLNGIDAPESGQPFGQRSKQNRLKLATQKQTEVIASSTDRYDRWLGTLIIDGININAE